MKPAPKDPRLNSKYRRAILARAAGDIEFQQECWARCARDPIWFVDTFGWIYAPKDYPDCPVRPFILYDFQEDLVRKLKSSFGKHDLLIEKSRDMGVTWTFIASDEHEFQFFDHQSILMGSRKQELVDKPGDPKSLFWKLDFFIEHLPGWLRPSIDPTSLHRYNVDNASTIDGESTNDDFARGDRRGAIDLDEFPAVDNGHAILAATRDATNSRRLIGTPQGASGAFYETREKMAASNPERIVTLHWTLHPEKRRGLYELSEDGYSYTILDTEYEFPEGFEFLDVSYPEFRTRSVWFNAQCARAASAQEIAQEIEIDYAKSGWQFFDTKVLARIKKENVRKPLHTGEIIAKPDWKHPEWCEQDKGGRIRLWFDPDVDGKLPLSWNDITCGVDTATGKGGDMSSSSVASFARKTTGEKIAEFSTNQLSPPEFCLYVLAMCRWMNNAFLIWEENGPGGEFTKQVKETDYRNVFYRNDDETKFVSKRTRKPGWWSNKETKRILLSDYAKALISGAFINRSEPAYDECGQYVHEPNGEIKHSRAKTTIDPTAAGENHGDIVIADALACRGITEIVEKEKDAPPPEPPPGSFGARRLAYLRRERNKTQYLGDWSVGR